MKAISILLGGLLALGAGAGPAVAQLSISSDAAPATLAGSYRLDFIVPDSPAANLLGFNESNILRPSSVREFATALSNVVSTGAGFTLPRSFAVEFSPGLLIGGRGLSLAAYRNNKTWYRLRLSGAALREPGQAGPTELAFGLRLSFIDEADLRDDDDFIQQVTAIDQQITLAVVPFVPPTGQAGEVDLNTLVLPDSVRAIVDAQRAKKTSLIAGKADQRWNNNAFDVALGARLAAKDSLGSDLRANDFVGWLTYARGFGAWGQWLFGLQAGSARDTTDNTFAFTGSASSRFYIGVNQYKAFLELQAASEGTGETFLINGGGEARLRNGMWVEFGGGTEYDFTLKQWRVISRFTVRIGLPSS